MLLMNRALLLGLFMMGTFVKKFDLLIKCESILMQLDDSGPNYVDTIEFYSVSSLKKANDDSSFIKLAFVVDKEMYHLGNRNRNIVAGYCQEIVMLANSLFQPYNIFIALVDIIIWAEENEIDIDSDNITVTHSRFKPYARDLFKDNHSIDYVVLLSYKLGTTERYSNLTQLKIVDKKCNLFTGVIKVSSTAESMAAQLIFLFGDGLKINQESRKCFELKNDENNKYFYTDTYEKEFKRYFKNPTEYQKKHRIHELMDKIAETKTNFSCLKIKPDILFKTPICGNNFTEPGEECDCKWREWWGYKKECDNKCCDAVICRLKQTHYLCAFGECCDLNKCSVKSKEDNIICRPASHQCDIAEYCDGEAPFCPKDKFVNDSRECSVMVYRFETMDDVVVFDQGTTKYKGVCNSKGHCQCKKKISSPIYKTYITNISTTVRSDSPTSSEDSQWKTYFFIQSAVILLIVTIILSVYVHSFSKCIQ